MNQQPIEKRDLTSPHALQVHSIFRTFQGEGPFTGTPCVFVRLAGCNLQCPGCDTEYTQGRMTLTPHQILDEVKRKGNENIKLVVITGGEPFRQNLSYFLSALVDNGYYVQIETNGTLEPCDFLYNRDIATRTGVYVVCSPKAGKVNRTTEKVACCYKYVLAWDDYDQIDGLPSRALYHGANPRVARPPKNMPVYLQPMDHTFLGGLYQQKNDLSLNVAMTMCYKFGYILQIQTHKLLGVP